VFVTGKFGKGIDLESTSSQYAYIAAASCPNLRIVGAQTWVAWMNLESLADGSNHRTIAGVLDPAGAHSYVLLRGSVVTTQKVDFGIAGLSATVSSDANPPTGEWVFIAARFNGTNELALWVNGTKKTQAVTGSQTAWNGDEGFGLGIAGGYAATQYMDGIVDDLAVFSKALTDNEISGIYSASSGGGSFLLNFV
jgi:hypothetical protein